MTEPTDTEPPLEPFHQSLDDIEEWYRDNDRAEVAEGLLPAASQDALREAETAAKSPFPRELRASIRASAGGVWCAGLAFAAPRDAFFVVVAMV